MMRPEALSRRLLAEGIGSALLAATVVGSGIMAQHLAGGNVAIALLANTGATVAVLYALIALLGPVSGAHFNPAVSGIEALRGRLSWQEAAGYSLIQIIGCCAGAWLAHLMFELPVWQLSTHVRSGPAQWLAEAVATFGLLLIVIGHRRSEDAPWMVACWIGAAYWFTASTSFANPAITIARSLTDTFAGIRPIDMPAFIGAQLIGAISALGVGRYYFPPAIPRRRWPLSRRRHHLPMKKTPRSSMSDPPVSVTIYHNPACGTSRNTLGLIRNTGVEPTVIEYLKDPPDRATLESLVARMGIRPRDLLRQKGTPYDELGLGADHWTDAELIEQMLKHPILINRPIVVTPWGAKLCRPSETVLDILPLPQKGSFVKEDGQPLIDAEGRRV